MSREQRIYHNTILDILEAWANKIDTHHKVKKIDLFMEEDCNEIGAVIEWEDEEI